jgi:hypothetical protein
VVEGCGPDAKAAVRLKLPTKPTIGSGALKSLFANLFDSTEIEIQFQIANWTQQLRV